jgi:hypothetical protein
MSATEDRDRAIPQSANWMGLPFGPFDPAEHRTLETGLHTWVEEQTQLQVGYVEQLYTFGDRGRYVSTNRQGPRVVSVGYLALAQEAVLAEQDGEDLWDDWYRYFPWEDWRNGRPSEIEQNIRPQLKTWVDTADDDTGRERRWNRARACFGFDDATWDEEKVLERYELLYEAGLTAETIRDQAEQARLDRLLHDKPDPQSTPDIGPILNHLGAPMQFDHRRILATAMGRLRGKLKYRPVVFELMAATFSLLELQRTVEAISGIRLHKQNFRRLVERSGLVEGTGQMLQTGGRPAEAFRFRREVILERAAAGVRVPRFQSGSAR